MLWHTFLLISLVGVCGGQLRFYKGFAVPINGSVQATSRSVHNTYRALYRSLFRKIIFKQDIREIDLVALVDASSGIRNEGFTMAKSFIAALVSLMPINDFRSRIRTGMYTYSDCDDLTSEFKLGDMKYRESTRQAFMNARFHGRTESHLATALERVGRQMSSKVRPAARKIIIIATDGYSNDDEMGIAPLYVRSRGLRDRGTEIFVLALGYDIELTKVAMIASKPKSDHIIHLKSPSSAAKILRKLMNKISPPVERTVDY